MRRLTRSPRHLRPGHHATRRGGTHTPADHRPRRGPVTPSRLLPGASAHRVLSRRSRPTVEAHASSTAFPSAPSVAAARAVSAARRSTVRRTAVVLAEVAVLAVVLSAAAVPTAHAETTHVLAIAESVDEVLGNIRNWIMGVLAGIATVFLTIGGVRRVMGAGDPGEQEKAKECFKAAGIGYCLAALAPLVVTVLKGIVGAQ